MTDPDPTMPIASAPPAPPAPPDPPAAATTPVAAAPVTPPVTPPVAPPVTPPVTPPPPVASTPAGTTRRPFDLDRVGVALGVALLSAAVVVSTVYTRAEGSLDASNLALGILATLTLLGVAAAAVVLSADRGRTSDLVGWPGAFGAVGAGLMVGVVMDDSSATAYVAGLLVVALSVGGYLVSRRAPLVVSTIAGLFVVYLQLCSDVVDLGGDGDDAGLTAAAVLLVFAVLVTAAGWPLPTRALSGVVVGVVTVIGYAAVLLFILVAGAFSTFGVDDDGAVLDEPTKVFHDDAWFVLAFALLLVLGWGVCASLTDHAGFRVLMVAMAVTVVPLAMAVLVVDHPTYWEVVLGAAGGLVLLAAGARSLGLPGRRTDPVAGGRADPTAGVH